MPFVAAENYSLKHVGNYLGNFVYRVQILLPDDDYTLRYQAVDRCV